MSNSQRLDWKKYEAITKYIYETLGSQTGVKIKGYGPTCKVTGKSGVVHQIDILAAHSDGIHSYQTAIECKFWNEKINKDIVMKVSEIIEDAGITKGVIVSKSGFTADGIAYAKHRNIGLVELREVEEKDLEGKQTTFDVGILQLRMRVTRRRPEVLRIELDSVENTKIEKEYWINNYILKLANGKQVPFANYLKEFQDELHRQNKEWQATSKRYEVPGATLHNAQRNFSITVNVITLTGVLTKTDQNTTHQFTLVDQVWLIMKSLFEQKTFTFSESGLIVEKKSA
jgi:hypothetical protein